jgi:hypothetical protein
MKVLILLAVLFLGSLGAFANTEPASAIPATPATPVTEKLSTDEKVQRLALLNQLLPLLLTRDQIRQLLPALEKARASIQAQVVVEQKRLEAIAPIVDRLYSEAMEDGAVPSQEEIAKIDAVYAELTKGRDDVLKKAAQDILIALQTILTESQRTVMANSLDLARYAPNTDPDSVPNELKILTYVHMVLLNPMTYDILVEMNRRKS